ncbi:anti-sigma factor [Streptomyces sp. NPDC005047]
MVSTVKTPAIPDDELLAPPPDVWDSITAELDISAAPADRVGEDDEAHHGRSPSSTGEPEPPTGTDNTGEPAPVRPRFRRLGRFTVILAACTALLGAATGSTITWWVTRDSGSTSSAVADGKRLDSLQASSAGYAQLSRDSGHRTLSIRVKGLPATSGYFEVWLMDSTHTKLVSMGVLGRDGRATLPVPDNIDLTEYSVVDVSIQPYNGKPDHSGDSIVRGPYAG